MVISHPVYVTEKNFERVALIIAPLLFSLSTFFWKNGEYTVPSATLLIISLFFWMIAFRGLFSITAPLLPRYSVWGLWVACFGCVSGICFAFTGYLTTVLGVSHEAYLEALARYPVTSQLLLFASGPVFPLSILVLGIQIARKKAVKRWVGILLAVAGVAFPASRIPRIDTLAHAADILLLIPCLYLASKDLHRRAYL